MFGRIYASKENDPYLTGGKEIIKYIDRMVQGPVEKEIVWRDKIIDNSREYTKTIEDLKKELEAEKNKLLNYQGQLAQENNQSMIKIQELTEKITNQSRLGIEQESEIQNRLSDYKTRLEQATQRAETLQSENKQITAQFQLLNKDHTQSIQISKENEVRLQNEFQTNLERLRLEMEMKIEGERQTVRENELKNQQDANRFMLDARMQQEKMKLQMNSDFDKSVIDLRMQHEKAIQDLQKQFYESNQSNGNMSNMQVNTLQQEIMTKSSEINDLRSTITILQSSKQHLENNLRILTENAKTAQTIRARNMEVEESSNEANNLITQFKVLSERNEELENAKLKLTIEIRNIRQAGVLSEVDSKAKDRKIAALEHELSQISAQYVQNSEQISNNLGASNSNYLAESVELQGKLTLITAKLNEVTSLYNIEFKKSQGLSEAITKMRGSYDDLIRDLIVSNEKIVIALNEEIGKLQQSNLSTDTEATKKIIALANELSMIQTKNIQMVAENKKLTDTAILVNQGNTEIRQTLMGALQEAENEKLALMNENQKTANEIAMKNIEIRSLEGKVFTWQSNTNNLMKMLSLYQSQTKMQFEQLITDFNQATDQRNKMIAQMDSALLSANDRKQFETLMEIENVKDDVINKAIDPLIQESGIMAIPVNTETGAADVNYLNQNTTTLEKGLTTLNNYLQLEVVDEQKIVNDLVKLNVKMNDNKVRKDKIESSFFAQIEGFYVKFKTFTLSLYGTRAQSNLTMIRLKKSLTLWINEGIYIGNNFRITGDSDLLNAFVAKYQLGGIPNKNNMLALFNLAQSMIISTLIYYWNSIRSANHIMEDLQSVQEYANKKQERTAKYLSELTKMNENIKKMIEETSNDANISFLLSADIYNKYKTIQGDYETLMGKQSDFFGILSKLTSFKSEIPKTLNISQISFREFQIPINLLYICISPIWSIGVNEKRYVSPFILNTYASLGYKINREKTNTYSLIRMNEEKNPEIENVEQFLKDYNNTSLCDLFLKGAIGLLTISGSEPRHFGVDQNVKFYLDNFWFNIPQISEGISVGAYAISENNNRFVFSSGDDLEFLKQLSTSSFTLDDLILYFADVFYNTHSFLKNMAYQYVFNPHSGESLNRDGFLKTFFKFIAQIYNKAYDLQTLIDLKIGFWENVTRVALFQSDGDLPEDRTINIYPSQRNQMVGLSFKYLDGNLNSSLEQGAIDLGIQGYDDTETYTIAQEIGNATFAYCTSPYSNKTRLSLGQMCLNQPKNYLEYWKGFYRPPNSFYNLTNIDSLDLEFNSNVFSFGGAGDGNKYELILQPFIKTMLQELDQEVDFILNDFFTASLFEFTTKSTFIKKTENILVVNDNTTSLGGVKEAAKPEVGEMAKTPLGIAQSAPIQLIVKDTILQNKITLMGEVLLNLINNHEIGAAQEPQITPGVIEGVLKNPNEEAIEGNR